MNLLRQGGLISLVVGSFGLLGLLGLGVTEEVALGALEGRAVMAENGQALKGATVIVWPLAKGEGAIGVRYLVTDPDGQFSLPNLPAGGYRVEASAKAHTLEETTIHVAEGPPTSLELELAANPPHLRLYASQRVFMPSEAPQIEVRGFGPGESISINVYKLRLEEIIKRGSIQSLLYGLVSEYDSAVSPDDVGKLVDTLDHQIANRDPEGTFVDALTLKKLPEGFYWVQCNLGELRKGAFVNVSKIGLVTKAVAGESLCFVADLESGQPIAGSAIYLPVGDDLKAAGKTNPDGTVVVSLAGQDESTALVAAYGDSRAIADFYVYGGDPDSPHTIFAYTDRPIYRPGDTVHFKGIVRKRQGDGYVLPGTGSASIEVRDESDTLIKEMSLPVRANGGFDGKFAIGDEVELGQYRVLIKAFDREHTIFIPLAAYRKPEFEIEISWSKKHYAFGERAKAIVKCNYYFGGPVAGARVTAGLFRNPAWDPYFDEQDEELVEEDGGEWYGGGDEYEELAATTNENGEAVIEFDTRFDKDPKSPETDYTYTLQANVADEGDKFFSAESQVRVTKGAFALSVDTDRYVVSPGERIGVKIRAYSHDDRKPLPNQTITVRTGTERWTRNESVFINRESSSVTTGPDGIATLDVLARDEYMVITALAKDGEGREIKNTTYVYVDGSGQSSAPGTGKLEITLDKKRYKPGDNCKVLLTTDKPGGAALLTVEASRVLLRQIVQLRDASTIVNLPVKGGYLPQVSVRVAMIRSKQFFQDSAALKLDTSVRKLMVSVTPSKAKYLPGEEASFDVRTTDGFGKAISADVSLAVVDESIFAIRKDDTNPTAGFYPAHGDLVQTSHSFPEIYLDGGDKGGEIDVRMDFKDTAAWVPTVQTDSAGQANIKITLPDNLTKWRATVVGFSDATDVGMGTGSTVASKPLMVRLQGPFFMVKGDRQAVEAIVTNDTANDSSVTVRLEPTGFRTDDRLEKRISVSAGTSSTLEWDVEAIKAGASKLIAKAWIENGPADGVEQKIDVLPHGRPIIRQASGETRGSDNLVIVVRDDADPDAGRLMLTFSPSVASGLYNSLDELIGFPYGCTEQTMSRFLPTLLVSKLPGMETSLPRKLKGEIPEMLRQGLKRLADMKHTDGGWGWWERDDSDPFMTAYVLDGLARAKAAKFPVNEYLITHGCEWATAFLKTSKGTRRERLYLAFAVLANRKTVEDIERRVLNDMDNATPVELATAILLMNEMKRPDTARRDEYVRRLKGRAIASAALAYWPEEPDAWGAESTAWALTALTSINPEDPMNTKIIRYLMQSRRGDWWFSTRDTSYSLIGITEFLNSTGEVINDSTVLVSVNGNQLPSLQLSGKRLDRTMSVRVPISDLKRGDNKVAIRVEGSPRAYYSMDFRQVAVAQRLGRVVSGSGFTIERTYHLMRAQRMENGTLRLQPSPEPITRARSGDVIQCRLKITTKEPKDYILVEDPFPSNCHVTEEEDGFGEWNRWWSRTNVLDDKVAFFSRKLKAGTNEITYMMRAESPGISNALPTVASNMYDPNQRASGSETTLEVRQ